MKIAKSVIDDMGMQSKLSGLIVDELSEADEIAGPGADHTQCIQSWEKRGGVQLRQSEVPEPEQGGVSESKSSRMIEAKQNGVPEP